MPKANALEIALQRAEVDPGHRPAFYRLLMESTAYVLAKSTPGKSVDQSSMQVMAWIRNDGVHVIPFFTSQDAARDAVPYVASQPDSIAQIPIRDLMATVQAQGHGMHLNPHCTYEREFTANEVTSLLEHGTIHFGVRPAILLAKTEIQIGCCRQELQELKRALSTLFTSWLNVGAAYMYEMDVHSGERWMHSIAIGVIGPSDDKLVHAIGCVIADVHRGNVPIDMSFLDEADDVLEALCNLQIPPFYHRAANLQTTQVSQLVQ